MTADDALKAHGFDGDKLLAYAHTIARREMATKASTLGDRREDLVMWLVEVGCRTAITYNPDRTSPTYTFSSYIYDVMQRRVPDFYRRKGEGYGDRRKGHDNRVSLVESPDIDEEADALEALISTDQLERYQRAAAAAGLALADWVAMTLDAAA